MRHPTIKYLYDVFSTYKLNEKIIGCDCQVCIDKEYSKYLHETPLNEIDEDSMTPYLESVGIVENDLNDFKYFIPRIIEIIFDSVNQGSYFYWIVWDTIGMADFNSWPQNESDAINSVIKSYWIKTKETNDKDRIEWTIEDLNKAKFKEFEFAKDI